MIPVYRLRRFHRILAVIIGVQICFWTLSGIYFAWTDLDEIHGDHLRTEVPPLEWRTDLISPSEIALPPEFGERPTIRSLELVEILGLPHYRLHLERGGEALPTLLVDARNGRPRPPLSQDEAVEIARAGFRPEARLRSARELGEEDVGPHHEYRGRPLPVWQVEFEHPSRTRIYVATREGTVFAHRNAGWRVFDFLWMLHTMDYLGRDDINNPVLRILSVFGLCVALSGYLLWLQTRKRKRSRA